MSALEHVWADYKAALAAYRDSAYSFPPVEMEAPDDEEWAERLHAAALMDWNDFEDRTDKAGKPYRMPVLRYVSKRGQAVTEPCLYCGAKHYHGDLPGHRSSHCAPHTHDLTRAGRPKNIYHHNTTKCPGCEGTLGYTLLKAEA